MKLIRRMRYTLTFLALFLAWVILRPDEPPRVYALDGETMGTRYRVQLWQFPESQDREVFAQQIAERLRHLDRDLMSLYAQDSQVSQFNRTPPGEWFPVAEQVIDVVSVAQEVSALSDGAFDITVAPLVRRWGFADQPGAAGGGTLPEQEELRALLDRVDYRQLEWRRSPPALRKKATLEIDLGGVAKGYAVDDLARYFDSLGLDSYFIEIGGEIRLQGTRPDGSQWVPAIERPGAGREVHAVLDPDGRPLALAGSGDYRNFFMANGTRYSHEIDPDSGRPVQEGLAAVYVISETAARADALSTAFMAMGGDRAPALARREDLAAYFIHRQPGDGSLLEDITPAFAGYLREVTTP